MDSKLEEYRAKKRRQATLNSVKDKLFNMVSFQQVKTDSKNEHVIIEELDETKSNSKQTSPLRKEHTTHSQAEVSSEEETVIPFTDSDEDGEKPTNAATEPKSKRKTYLKYLTYLVYFLFWATCWAIAIQLKFGIVYLLLSGIFGVYFNTRTGPKNKKEISAYSVFNKDCHSIDGTLKAEQFDREIRYGPINVR